MLIPCLAGPIQQAMATLPSKDIAKHEKVHDLILQTLSLSPEVYQQRLQESEFGPDYHPQLTGHRIRVPCMRVCMHPAVQTAEQIVEVIMSKHYTSVLPFTSRNGVLHNQPTILKEAYASTEADLYLISKAWKNKGERIRY